MKNKSKKFSVKMICALLCFSLFGSVAVLSINHALAADSPGIDAPVLIKP